MGAGKKRTIMFNSGDSPQEKIEAKGMLKGDMAVCVSQGLPNTSSKQSVIYIYFHKSKYMPVRE